MVLAPPGVARQGEAVGMLQRQRGERERGAPHMGGAPSLGMACKIPGGTMQAVSGPGYFCCTDKSCAGLNDIK